MWWGRFKKTRNPGKIFVSIASFCDPDLENTLTDIFDKAATPEHLRVVVCLQDSEETYRQLSGKFGDKVEFLFVRSEESGGCCWARSLIQQQISNEPYYMQLDSHHRFARNWDVMCRTFLAHCGTEKAVLTSYLPSFDPRTGDRDGKPYVLKGEYFYDNDKLRIQPAALDDPEYFDKPVPAHLLSAHFIFTYRSWALQVPYDPEMYFEGEEDTLSVRSYTHGWDLFHPHRIIAWHHYTRTNEPRHHDVVDSWVALHEKSLLRMRQLLGMEPGEIKAPFGLGSARQLRDYEQYSGIWFRQRLVSDSLQSLIRRQNLWKYGQGYFKRIEDKRWAEVQEDREVNRFLEVDHSPGCLILWDPLRQVWVKLLQNNGWFKHPQEDGVSDWVCFTEGAWNVAVPGANTEPEEQRIRRISQRFPGHENITVITMKTPNTDNWAFSSEINQTGYCRQYGYPFVVYRDLALVQEYPHWNKVWLWQKHLEENEWLMWIDSDAIFTRNDLPLSHITDQAEGKDLLVCDDIGGWRLNTGVMLMRNTPWMQDIIQRLWAMEHVPHSKAAEQSSLINLLGIMDPEMEHWKVFDQKAFNTHPRVHRDGDFILHMMGLSGEERLRTFTDWNKKLGYQ